MNKQKTLAELTPEEREELYQQIQKTPVDQVFIDMFCEMFNVNPDAIMAGEGVPNE